MVDPLLASVVGKPFGARLLKPAFDFFTAGRIRICPARNEAAPVRVHREGATEAVEGADA